MHHLRYPSLGHFLRDFLAPAYARQVADTAATVWCPEPWLHPEATHRLNTLWQTYEHAVVSPHPTSDADWWLGIADPMMHVLLHPAGPFKFCSVRNGHKSLITPLPMNFDAAPAELFGAVASITPAVA